MINILDKQIADKIAAGEVIERPVSIIKELVENSIDAGADSIVIEIKKGGKAYIRVTDNGSGISWEDTKKAFLRHATSKISKVSDLDSIETLGFRGEALASIAAVTRTELLTKRREDKIGSRVIVHGGEIISNQPVGCPDGTTFIITDLFYNTPARLKFMKSDAAESSLIIDLVSQLALAYKNVSFRLINNGNVLFATSGDGNRLNIISRVFSNIDTKNLVSLKYESDGLSIEGYISTPAMSRTGKNGQIFFVNGRVVNSKVIEKGISEGYRERLFDGRHPVVFLFLNVNSSDLDVNIHPNKREVRFDHENEIEEFISTAVKNALGTKEAIVRAANIFKESIGESKTSQVKEEQVFIKNIMSTNWGPEKKLSPAIFDSEIIETPNEPKQITEIPEEIEEEKDFIHIQEPFIKPFEFDNLIVLGVLFNTYIMAVDEDNFYLFDQHAAHERIFYEKLISEYDREEKVSQPILMPILLNVSTSSRISEESWLAPLRNMGFVIDNFGQNSYRISEIPTFMGLQEGETFVKDFTDNLDKHQDLKNTVVIDKLIMKSCKSAVKAHDHLKDEEISALMQDLKTCINPFSCPHGRPTFIKLSNYEIERLFKRV
ncbi:MAG: DNA mismatch repair endonuclease MutL [Firmicutes bacterium]|jgi:DNA mismatch repair protein MutL|nr:DNA mismatch repair endonuclease MutL [Bacillota bacterium]